MFTAAKLAQYRKGITAVLGVLVQAIALGVLHGTALHYAQLAVGALTALGVLLVENDRPDTPGAKPVG